ncbi:MAG: hypothetical protein ABEJ65_04000, partial [bacterium]
MTTAWNARVGKRTKQYITRLKDYLSESTEDNGWSIMVSNGGLRSPDSQNNDLTERPILLSLSGGASTGTATRRVARELDLKHC